MPSPRHVLSLRWSPEQTREALIEILTQEIQARRKEIRAHTQRVNKAKELALRVAQVPESPTLDRMMRYEASLERAFFRCLHELHRLQAARAGVPVPPRGGRRGFPPGSSRPPTRPSPWRSGTA